VGQCSNEAVGDGICHDGNDDGDSLGGLLCRKRCLRAGNDNYIEAQTRELISQQPQSIVVQIRVAVLDRDAFAVHIPVFAQALSKVLDAANGNR